MSSQRSYNVVTSAGPGVTCTSASSRTHRIATCATPALAPGASATANVKVTAPVPAGISAIRFYVSVTGPTNSASAFFDVHYTGPADLQPRLTLDLPTVIVGDTVTAFGRLFNGGYTDATNAAVRFDLPAGASFVSATSTNGFTCAPAATVVLCTGGSVPWGTTALLDVIFAASATAGQAAVSLVADPAKAPVSQLRACPRVCAWQTRPLNGTPAKAYLVLC